jgi:hypothetical protein
MKQSAVEWLVDKLFDPPTLLQEQIEWIEKAKEMEKEQMIDFTMDFMGEDNGYESYRRESALDLFNKTFNTNEE